MRKISADYIFPIATEPIKNGVISVDDDGTIINVESDNQGANEHYEGIICPGFINTHCHLELSHMRSQVSENAGMIQFIKEILSKRSSFSEEEIQDAISIADAEMIKNGIVAVGDISNSIDTFNRKAKSSIFYHTFIEVFDFNPEKADETFETAKKLSTQLSTLNFELSNSIVPHAPYSVSEKLFRLIADEAVKKNSIISIHNQESLGESELFISHSGPMFEAFSKMGINMELIPKTGVNSLRTTLPKLPLSQKTLLVHNTFTTKEDLQWVKNYQVSSIKYQELYWCSCPNANIYIENKLPDYDLFIEENLNVTIGTDSLASNWSLSILDELKTISKYYPQIPLQTLLTWATRNGAEFLGLNQLGTLEKGKKPGLNLLKNVDGMMITEKTEIVKLV